MSRKHEEFKILQGVVVIVVATASAITSYSLPSPNAFIKVKFTRYALNFDCINSGVSCQETGTIRCLVHIPELNIDALAYKSGCILPLYGNETLQDDLIPQKIVAVDN